MASSSSFSAAAAAATATTPRPPLHPWETSALENRIWKIEGPLQKFTEAEARALIISHGGIMASDEKSATHTLKPSASGGAFFLITGNNSSGTIWETGFISYIRSNAIGKRMNFATPGCLEDLVFAVLGTLPWLTIEEVGEIVSASGGLLLRKSKRPKIPIEKPLDYVIVGEGADAEDVEAARRLGVEVIDEQGLFDVIHDKDGMRTRRTGVTESRAERFLKALRGDKEKEEEGEGSGSGGGMADGGTNPPPQKRQETSSSSAARGGNAPIVLE